MLLVTQRLNQILRERVTALWAAELPTEASFDVTRSLAHGDLSSTAALRLASVLRNAPPKIAAQLASELRTAVAADPSVASAVQSVEPMGGFVNVTLSREFWNSLAHRIPTDSIAYGRGDRLGAKAQVEFVSANPTGPLTVAHGRQAALGDTLCRILDAAGYDVNREYYLNDTGNQMRMLGLSVWYRMKEMHGETIELPENCYRGEYIREIAAEAEVRFASELAAATDEQAVDLLARFAGEFILNWIKGDLEDFRVTLETWFSQREMEDSGAVDRVVDDYRAKDLVYEKDGALWLKTSRHGDSDDRVVVKQDGSYTYRTPDIAYHCDKFNRGFEQMFVLLGPDHHAHTITMKAALRALGLDADRLKHIIIQHCTLYRGGEPLKMSTRRATYVTLREIMDAVGVDAARFFFLNRSAESHLDFDLELAVKQASDNPVFYLQYASARCASILAKAQEDGFFGAGEFHDDAFQPTPDDIALMESDEVELLRYLGRFPLTIQRAAANAEAMKVINYLTESVENFHNYYQRRRVMTDDKAASRARLAVVSAFRQVLANGLWLLGVSAPVRM